MGEKIDCESGEVSGRRDVSEGTNNALHHSRRSVFSSTSDKSWGKWFAEKFRGSNAVAVQSPRSRGTWKFSFRCCWYMKLPQDMCFLVALSPPGGDVVPQVSGFKGSLSQMIQGRRRRKKCLLQTSHLTSCCFCVHWITKAKKKREKKGYKRYNDERRCCVRGASSRVYVCLLPANMNDIQHRVCALLMSPMPSVLKECHRNRRIIGRGGSFDANRAIGNTFFI